MRRWLLDLHLYLGLFCLPYVVVFGVSSLLLVHGAPHARASSQVLQVAALRGGEAGEEAQRVQAELGLRGTILGFTVKRGGDGGLSFAWLRPGRKYVARVAPSGAAVVETEDGGVLGVIAALHGAKPALGVWWSDVWSAYTELTAGVLAFSIASGAWLALSRAGGRALALGAAALGSAACVALAAAIW